MAFPVSLTLVPIHGTFVRYPDGSACYGNIEFRCRQLLSNPMDNISVPPFVKKVILDVDGQFAIDLPATNDPDWTPNGWSYEVISTIDGHRDEGSLFVPYDADGVDYADTVNSDPPIRGNSYVLLSSANAPGGYPRLDSQGHIAQTQILFPVLVLEATELVPDGTPVNTVIVRKT